MPDDPFVIKIPKGATEIDLRPLLGPIILALMPHISTDKNSSRPPVPSDIDGFIQAATDARNYRALIESLDRQHFKTYLEANGWKKDYGDHDSVYVRYSDRVNLMANDSVFNQGHHYRDEAVRQIQHGTVGWYLKSRLYVARQIAASRSVLDQLAAATDEVDGDED